MESEINPAVKPETGLTGRQEDWFERMAFGASMVCLVHCLALPLLFAALPALDRALNLPASIHVWILLFAIPTSCAALIGGQMRHFATWPLLTGLAGLGLLALGAFTFGRAPAETVITVTGSLLLVTAHIGNWRLRHSGHAHG